MNRERFDEVGRLLAIAIPARRAPLESAVLRECWRTNGPEPLAQAAEDSQVLPLISCGFASVDGIALPEWWRASLDRNTARGKRLLDALVAVVGHLVRAGIARAAIETGGVMLGSALPFAAYSPGDIDLIHAAGRYEEVRAAIEAERFVPAQRRGRSTERLEYRCTAADSTTT